MRPVDQMTDQELASEWLAAERAANDPLDEQERIRAGERQLDVEHEQDRRESDRDVQDSA